MLKRKKKCLIKKRCKKGLLRVRDLISHVTVVREEFSDKIGQCKEDTLEILKHEKNPQLVYDYQRRLRVGNVRGSRHSLISGTSRRGMIGP